VSKRHALVAAGIPAGALRLAVVRTRGDEGHLVLVVSTSRGDLVLDNLTTAVTSWDTTRYRWLKIQSAVDPKLWADVAGASKLASR
jgi:predicted transglutaminase-like cysteine proteinase